MSDSRRPYTRSQARKDTLTRRANGPSTAQLGGHSIFKTPQNVSAEEPSQVKEGELQRTTRVYDAEELRAAMDLVGLRK